MIRVGDNVVNKGIARDGMTLGKTYVVNDIKDEFVKRIALYNDYYNLTYFDACLFKIEESIII